MVVGFTTTYAISAHHHDSYEFESRSERGVQHYVIKFVSVLQQVGGFLRVLRSSTNKTDRHDITEILLKLPLRTINQQNQQSRRDHNVVSIVVAILLCFYRSHSFRTNI
jgi:hypothetical protein